MVCDRGWLGQGGLACVLGMGGAVVLGLPEPALAQLNLIPDTEPGLSLNTQVNQVDDGWVVDNGTRSGNNNNLFHSFAEFNVPENQTVTFNSGNFKNILSRVTGNDPSDILGTLEVDGPANLFLLNPNGITFGPNAQLDLKGGSFVATTANAIGFPTGGEFSTTSTVVPDDALLTVNPSALFFNETPAGAIVNQSTTGLEVPTGESLFLVGGEVRVENGGTLRAPGGRIELGGLAEEGKVEIIEPINRDNPDLNFPDVRLQFPEGVERADITLTNGAAVDVVAGDGGDIAIRGEDIRITGSNVCAGIGSTPTCGRTTASPTSLFSRVAGNILLDATGEVSISQSSRIENNINEGATGIQGNIFEAIAQGILFGSIAISAENFSLTDSSQISTSTFGDGSAGLVLIGADDQVFVNNSQIFSNSNARGDAGGISIVAEDISLSNAELESKITGLGTGGVILLRGENGSVSLDNTIVRGNVEAGALGSALGILIEADSISLSNETELQTQTAGIGNAGSVILRTEGGTISLDNSRVFASVESGGQGKGGNIQIETGSLSMSNDSELQTLIREGGQGDAGLIFVQASDSVSLSRSQMFSSIEKGGEGQTGSNEFAGNVFGALFDRDEEITGSIFIDTGTLSLDESLLTSSSSGIGNAGAVVILADDTVSLDNRSDITSRVEVGGQGDAGGILMGVDSLSVAGNSQVSTSALGQGNPGLILVGADDEISLEGTDNLINDQLRPSGIFSQVGRYNANPDVIGGGMILEAEAFSITDGAVISVSNLGEGTAGDLIITAHEDIILNNRGAIAAVSESGKGGNIILTSGDFLLLLDGSTITTDAFNPVNPSVNAGNIFVLTRYVIAAPFRTNDIVANAVEGFGGNVFVFAARLYDIEERVEVFPTNDIDASSDFGIDGTVTENVLNVDPTQGLTNLPANPVDPSTLIAETCAPRGGLAEGERNQFIVTGRGGLPPDPNAAFPGEAVVDDAGLPEEESPVDDSSSANPASGEMASSQAPDRIEAQGWVYGEDGKIIFTAQAHTATPSTPALTPASICNDVSTSHQPR